MPFSPYIHTHHSNLGHHCLPPNQPPASNPAPSFPIQFGLVLTQQPECPLKWESDHVILYRQFCDGSVSLRGKPRPWPCHLPLHFPSGCLHLRHTGHDYSRTHKTHSHLGPPRRWFCLPERLLPPDICMTTCFLSFKSLLKGYVLSGATLFKIAPQPAMTHPLYPTLFPSKARITFKDPISFTQLNNNNKNK